MFRRWKIGVSLQLFRKRLSFEKKISFSLIIFHEFGFTDVFSGKMYIA